MIPDSTTAGAEMSTMERIEALERHRDHLLDGIERMVSLIEAHHAALKQHGKILAALINEKQSDDRHHH
jgi:hypothetical protein